ncbi:GerAB/ArcD/ProY family transporter [Neobacillus cucumis]|uniref:GerAB/ArcD/ProY family transporter n=1 Tax=Neobacillus cucumis TaxID=1740721 RepID=UPI002853420E|nr:GerAB/ArcD/ProY family transporter [Neobacillus cucumis]MDR4948927.1 GerAB/ArcD/ProY family transporter [Neobacillus cucumis]
MKVRISNGIFMALIINMVYSKAIGLTQGAIAREVGGDMWISTILSSLQGILMMLLTIYIIRKSPSLNIFEQSGFLLGKWFSKIICLLTFLFFLGASGAVFTTFVYHLKDYFLPEAPTLLFVLAGFLIAVFALYHGIEVIGRLALIGVFFIILLNILIILGSISEFDIRELMPLMGNGVIPDLWASRYNNTDWAMATMMATIILPLVKDHQTWGKSGALGIFLGGLFVVLWPILEAGVLTSEVTGQYIISCMQMARSAEIGLFIHRYEMIMIALFSLSLLTQMIMTFYCATVSVQSLFGLKSINRSIIPVGLLLSAFGYWIVLDHHRAIIFIETDWVILSMSLAVGIPFLLLILGVLFRRKFKKHKLESMEA